MENKDKINNDSENTKIKKAMFLKKIADALGNISLACIGANIHRRTYYYWIETDEEFKKDVEIVNEKNIDFAESQLLKNIKSGKEQSLLFYLRTKGRSRGYAERQEKGLDNEKIVLNFTKELPKKETE